MVEGNATLLTRMFNMIELFGDTAINLLDLGVNCVGRACARDLMPLFNGRSTWDLKFSPMGIPRAEDHPTRIDH